MLHEVTFTTLPIDEQILGEKHRHDHPQAVVHVASGVQAAHRGVDDGITGASLAPRRELCVRAAPFQLVVLRAERAAHDVREVVQNLQIKFAPNEFVQEHVATCGGGRRRCALPGGAKFQQHMADANRSCAKMCGELRCAILIRAVSCRGVGENFRV